MSEEHLSPRRRDDKAMGQITGAVIAITVVLAAVFVPSALQAGHRRRDLQAVRDHDRDVDRCSRRSSRSAFTPALCATILKPARSRKPQHRVPLVQQRVRLGAQDLRRPHRERSQQRAALDDPVRRDRAPVRMALHAPARQLPARRGPGLHARDRAAAARRDASSARPRSWTRSRACCRSRKASTAMMRIIRLQLRRPGRERRHGVRPAEAMGRAQGHRRRFHPASPTARCAAIRDATIFVVNLPTVRGLVAVRRLRHVPAGSYRPGPRRAGRRTQHAARGRREGSDPAGRAPEHARGRATAAAQRRSRAGAVDGPFGQRRVSPRSS